MCALNFSVMLTLHFKIVNHYKCPCMFMYAFPNCALSHIFLKVCGYLANDIFKHYFSVLIEKKKNQKPTPYLIVKDGKIFPKTLRIIAEIFRRDGLLPTNASNYSYHTKKEENWNGRTEARTETWKSHFK